MRDKHVYAILGGGLFFILVNAKFRFVDSTTLLIFGLVGAIIVVRQYSGDGPTEREKTSISPNEALPEIQDYLEEAPGKRKLWLHADDSESTKLHDRTKYHEVAGEMFHLYGVVGRPVDPNSGEPDYGEMIGVIWNLSKNEFVSSDMELPPALGVESRLDPFEAIDDWVEEIGGTVKDDDTGGTVQQNFYTNRDERREQARSTGDGSE